MIACFRICLFFLSSLISFSQKMFPSSNSLKLFLPSLFLGPQLLVAFARTWTSVILQNQTVVTQVLAQQIFLASASPVAALFSRRFTALHFSACLRWTTPWLALSKEIIHLSHFSISIVTSVSRKLKSRQHLATYFCLGSMGGKPEQFFRQILSLLLARNCNRLQA